MVSNTVGHLSFYILDSIHGQRDYSTSCSILVEADDTGVTPIELKPSPAMEDYLQAMQLANQTADRESGEHMLLAWHDRDWHFESPQHASECHVNT